MAKGLNLEQNRMFWNKTEDGKKHSEVNSNWKQHFTTARTKGTASVRGILCLHLSCTLLVSQNCSQLQCQDEKRISAGSPGSYREMFFFFLGKVHNWAEANESKATQNGSVLFNWYCLSSKCFLQFCGNVHLPHLSALSSCFGGFFFCSWKQRCSSSRLCCHERHLTSLNYGKMESFYYAGAVQSKNC